MPEVSTIIPTYNRAGWLEEAIRSVLDQTFYDLEVIVVDDASNDSTAEIVRSITDGRVSYVRHDQNSGAGAARNTGIRVAKGAYIAFQDSDDIWLPQKLEKQMNVIRNAPPEVGVVYSRLLRVEGSKKTRIPSGNRRLREGNLHRALLRDNFVGTPAVLARSECFAKAGLFSEDLPMLEDWELWIRISRHYEFRGMDEVLTVSRATEGSVNLQSYLIQVQAVSRIIERNQSDFGNHRRELSHQYFRMGTLFSLAGMKGPAKACYLKAVRTFPFYPWYYPSLLRSVTMSSSSGESSGA